MSIDHVSLRVSDFGRSMAFFRAALAPLNYRVMMEFPGGYAGMGDTKPWLWITQTPGSVTPTHLAISATRDQVDAFHAAALAAGGIDDGAPGLRPDYHANYYGAFVRDPDGNSIEAVCHAPPLPRKAAAPGKATAPRKKARPAKAKKPLARNKPAARPKKKKKR